MTERQESKQLIIKLVQAKNGGFALHVDDEFDTACSKGDEALEWFAKQMKDRFGETTRRSIEHASILDQLAGKVADHLSAKPQQPQIPHQTPGNPWPAGFMPAGPHTRPLPPELPREAHQHDDAMPRIVDEMRDAADPETANLTARLASEMSHRNGQVRTSVLALVAMPVAMFLWRASMGIA